MQIDEIWAEPLPENCPPTDSFSPSGQVFFRLVESYPPRVEDFYSTRMTSPNRKIQYIDECTMRSCSIFASYESCDNVRKITPKFRSYKIVKLRLDSKSGLIKPTFNHDHFSWWKFADCNPIQLCVDQYE